MQIKQSLTLAAIALAVSSSSFAQEQRAQEPGDSERRNPAPEFPQPRLPEPRFAEIAVDRVSVPTGDSVRLTVTSKLQRSVLVALRFRDDQGRVLSEMTTELMPFEECTFEMDAADPLMRAPYAEGGAIQVTASYEVLTDTWPGRRPDSSLRSFRFPVIPLLDAVVEVVPDPE
ncbi:MAG: hypothetical protein NTV70_07550 [Acidobacteria bacterium]|nr:hypothetical protein [Acidobacteriota bacterium]